MLARTIAFACIPGETQFHRGDEDAFAITEFNFGAIEAVGAGKFHQSGFQRGVDIAGIERSDHVAQSRRIDRASIRTQRAIRTRHRISVP